MISELIVLDQIFYNEKLLDIVFQTCTRNYEEYLPATENSDSNNYSVSSTFISLFIRRFYFISMFDKELLSPLLFLASKLVS